MLKEEILMIEVDISGTEFSYDMKALAMVFYPEKRVQSSRTSGSFYGRRLFDKMADGWKKMGKTFSKSIHEKPD